MKLRYTITPLIGRVMVFLGLFVVLSGILGPRIISSGLLFSEGFSIYGSLGKALLFGVVVFVLLAQRHSMNLRLRSWQPALLGWAALSGAGAIGAWTGIDALLTGHRSILVTVLTHSCLLVAVAAAALACFGVYNLVLIWQQYFRAIVLAAMLTAGFYIFLLVVYGLWQPLASMVLASVHSLLSLSGLHVTIGAPYLLLFDKFGITIAEYCSGVESIALFTGLYAVVGLMDWHRLRYNRFFMIFPVALLLLFLLNIVRIYGLIMAGYYINPDIAFSLFHTYAGLVFFILYSAVFWSFFL